MSAKKKIALVLLGSATLILLALAIGYFKMGAEADAELNAEIKRSKAAGTWLESISDLVVPVPKERNAAPLYQQAFQLVEKIKEPSGSWFDTPEGMAKIKKFVEDISPAMKIAKDATKFSDCQFDHHYDSPAELYPEMLTLKTLSQGFVVRAELESREGSPDKSIDDLVTAGKIAHHIGQAPILIASLVQISRDTAILAELEKLLTSWPKIAAGLPKSSMQWARFRLF